MANHSFVLIVLCAWAVVSLGQRLTFYDDFNDATIDPTKWNIRHQYIYWGGLCSKDNAYTDKGSLVLRTIAKNQTISNQPYYVETAFADTSGTFEQLYGKWEMRAWLPDVDTTSGYTLCPSFILEDTSPCSLSIDLIKQYADTPYPQSRVEGDIHPARFVHDHCTGGNTTNFQICKSRQDFEAGYHTFSLEWNKTSLAWSIDDKPWYTYDDLAIDTFTTPMHIVLSPTVVYKMVPNDSDKFPQLFSIDWVKVWQWV